MITTGIIREINLSSSNYKFNKYKVELNIFQKPGDNDDENYILEANCSVASGLYSCFKKGDKVYVGFINNNYSQPVILGKIYQGLIDEPRSYAYFNSIKISDSAEFPKNTKIGDISYEDLKYAITPTIYNVRSVDGQIGDVDTKAVKYTEQALTDEQKNIATKNISLRVSTELEQSELTWRTVGKLKNNYGVISMTIATIINGADYTESEFLLSISYLERASITQIGNSYGDLVSAVRLRGSSDDSMYIDLLLKNSNSKPATINVWFDVKDNEAYRTQPFSIIEFEPFNGNEEDYTITTLNLNKNGINTTGKIYENGGRVLSVNSTDLSADDKKSLLNNIGINTSLSSTLRDFGQWVISVAGGSPSGLYLLGSFYMYDTNVHMSIQGGLGDSNIDYELDFASVNYVLSYVKCISKGNIKRELYYTHESDGYVRIYIQLNPYEKLSIFTETSGGVIGGRGLKTAQNPSNKIAIPIEEVAQLSQVVRTDTPQTLTAEQRQRAQNNIGIKCCDYNYVGVGTQGWHNLLEISSNAKGTCFISHGYNYKQPFVMSFDFSVSFGYTYNITITASGQGPGNSGKYKLRFAQINGRYYIQLYFPHTQGETFRVAAYTDSDVYPCIVLDNTVTDVDSQFIAAEIEVKNGINTTGGLYQNGNSVANQNGTYSTLIAGGNTIVDTRAVNSPPSYYADKETCYEFKSRDTLGLTDYMPNSYYVLLTTKKGWVGSYVVYQEAVSAGNDQSSVSAGVKCYRYGLGETWGEWQVVAKTSQVVRTDTAQSLTDGQKQQAQQNMVIHNSSTLSSVGWYRILKPNRGIYEISLNRIYKHTVPIPTKIFVSYGWGNYNSYSITSIGGGDSAVTKARLSKDSSGNVYVDIYYDSQLDETVSYTVSGYSLFSTFENFEAVDFTAVSDDITELVSIDLLKGINTSGNIYQNGCDVLAIRLLDLMNSSGDLGWSSSTNPLLYEGVYLIRAGVMHKDTSLFGAKTGTGIIFVRPKNIDSIGADFDSEMCRLYTAGNPLGTRSGTIDIIYIYQYNSDGTLNESSTKWKAGDSTFSLRNIYYKKLI